MTQVAAVTNTKTRDKSAIYNAFVFPKVSIVDPELNVTPPEHMTAFTGFDAFCHAFESMLHPNASSYINTLAVAAIQLIVDNLPVVLKDLKNLKAREKIPALANQSMVLPDYKGNPRVATEDEMLELIKKAYYGI